MVSEGRVQPKVHALRGGPNSPLPRYLAWTAPEIRVGEPESRLTRQGSEFSGLRVGRLEATCEKRCEATSNTQQDHRYCNEDDGTADGYETDVEQAAGDEDRKPDDGRRDAYMPESTRLLFAGRGHLLANDAGEVEYDHHDDEGDYCEANEESF